MKNKTVDDLAFYMGLRCPVTIHEDPGGGFVGEIEALPGCATQAETLEELYDAIDDARKAWIRASFEDGIDIPLPPRSEEFSGRFLV